MNGYLQLDHGKDTAVSRVFMRILVVFAGIGLAVGAVVCIFFSKNYTSGDMLVTMGACLVVAILLSCPMFLMTDAGRESYVSGGKYERNISRFEKAYGVKTSSFIPKDGRRASLENLVGAADYGTREYMYLYDGNSQNVTINIDADGRLRMIGDGKVIPPSSHHHAGKLE